MNDEIAPSEPTRSASPISTFLDLAMSTAAEGTPLRLTVRELIGHWGASSRGNRVRHRIWHDLAERGLETYPDFRKVSIDSSITIQHAALPLPSTTAEDAAIKVVLGDASDSDELEETGFGDILTVGTIPSATLRQCPFGWWGLRVAVGSTT